MKILWSVAMVSLCSIASMCYGSGCNLQTDTIRLVGGLSDQGLVEICDDNQWKSVCDLLWNDMKAGIVCHELNLTYFGAQAVSGGGCSAFNMSTSDEGILIQVCTGEERSITECQTTVVKGNCSAAGVICSSPCDPSSCNDTDSQCSSPNSTCYCPTPSDTNCTCYEAMCSPACLNGGTCAAQGECQCPPGWTGHTCQQVVCDPPCFNEGTCTQLDICQCPDMWEGDHCQQAVCNPPCSNGGNCTGPDTCQCPDTWESDHCQQATCEVGFCLNGGTCLYPDTNCTCPVGWTGSRCNQNSATLPETTFSVSENNDQEMTGIAASSATVVCLVLLALAATVTAFLVDRRRRRRRRVRFFKQSIRHAENTEEPSQIPAAELLQTPAAELQQIPPAGLPQTQTLTAEQNLPAASVRSSSIPIPTYSMVSRPHRPSLTSSQTNIESLYDEVVPSNICACRVERLGTMERELGREDTETVESVLYRSTEELKAEPAIDEFNIYDSPT